MKIIAVFNYPTGCVDLFNIPDTLKNSDEIEAHLQRVCKYRLSDIYWMAPAQINYRTDLNEKAFK